MPGKDAEVGDVYRVSKQVVKHPERLGKNTRPLVCMAIRPMETTWLGLPRISSGARHDDARDSAAVPEIGLDRTGWFSARYVHPVRKDKTGVPGLCDYLGALPKDQMKDARHVFRNREFDE